SALNSVEPKVTESPAATATGPLCVTSADPPPLLVMTSRYSPSKGRSERATASIATPFGVGRARRSHDTPSPSIAARGADAALPSRGAGRVACAGETTAAAL